MVNEYIMVNTELVIGYGMLVVEVVMMSVKLSHFCFLYYSVLSWSLY